MSGFSDVPPRKHLAWIAWRLWYTALGAGVGYGVNHAFDGWFWTLTWLGLLVGYANNILEAIYRRSREGQHPRRSRDARPRRRAGGHPMTRYLSAHDPTMFRRYLRGEL